MTTALTKNAIGKPNGSNGANLGFEDKLWAAADKLRGNMDAAEYKHVVLGLIFLKYISDAFMEKFTTLRGDKYADPEDKDEYLADNIFWVPPEARWFHLQKNAKQPGIGMLVDDALTAVERDNKVLKGVLPKDYARPALDKARLGEIIGLIATIGLGDRQARERDVLGRVYEYFLGKFAAAEGKLGGRFYTPQCVVKLLVEMLEPYEGRVFDPCCGSGGMFVQAAKFVQSHASGNGNGKKPKVSPAVQCGISIFGQESNNTTWRLALMNLAIRGIDGKIEWGDSFLADKHKDLKADYILANPPFNMEDWGYSKVKNDVRWRRFDQPSGNARFSLPPGGERKRKDGSFVHVDGGNANYAWILHFLHHLAPSGTAGFVLANGSLTSNASGEGDIRKAIIEADMVDCIIALPGQLFYTTPIPACLWFLARNKGADKEHGYRARTGETLFIDARKMGSLTDRTHRELTDNDIAGIAGTYHAWRGEKSAGKYKDKQGFCKSAALKEIEAHGHVLSPGRYVGAEEIEDDGVPFEEKMAELSAELYVQMREALELDAAIRQNLEALGYGE
ncbi:MAG: type I restriction-modification system subunit M [Planctomycetota bacterium]|nr:type I restriction-modification system subunit M [Planctomycetota bacterium]